MNDLVLRLAVRWLTAVDAFAASCVSSEWQEALSPVDQDAADLWKQVCQNSYPLLFASLLEEEEIDFRWLTLGLWRGKIIMEREPETTTIEHTPTLRPEDVFVIVEIYQQERNNDAKKKNRNILASWKTPISFPELIARDDSGSVDKISILKAPNPFSESEQDPEKVRIWHRKNRHFNTRPYGYALWKATGRRESSKHTRERLNKMLHVRVTLFRRDNMTSFRMPDMTLNYWQTLGEVEKISLWEQRVSPYFVCFLSLSMIPKLPAPASEEEPTWLANCRQALGERRQYRLDEADRNALSKIPHFEYEMQTFDVKIASQPERFYTQNDMMVVLERLCWE